jgi:hypothetical protein
MKRPRRNQAVSCAASSDVAGALSDPGAWLRRSARHPPDTRRATREVSKLRKDRLGQTRREGRTAIRLRVGDPDLVESLSEFLRKRECAVEHLGAETLAVGLPHDLHAEQAHLELDLYLRVWQSLHDWTPVEYVDVPPAP